MVHEQKEKKMPEAQKHINEYSICKLQLDTFNLFAPL